MQQLDRTADGATPMKRSLWIALVIAGSIGFSFAFSCATPFAALATLAALNTPRRDLFALLGLAWLANQAIGYGLLGYPQTWHSLGWGAAIGIAALLGTLAALAVAPRVARLGRTGMIAATFLAAFTPYELALYAASFVLGSADAFLLPVVWRIFYMNVFALVALLIVHQLALAAGLIVAGGIGPRPALSVR